MRYSTTHQTERIRNGNKNEQHIKKLFKAKSSLINAYDLETQHRLIEVKSCKAFNNTTANKKTYKQLGRFTINNNNHVDFKLQAMKENKIPVYMFVVTIKKNKIFTSVKWITVERLIDYKKKFTFISWGKIF